MRHAGEPELDWKHRKGEQVREDVSSVPIAASRYPVSSDVPLQGTHLHSRTRRETAVTAAHPTARRTRRARGFTLIELMITVAVVALLARIAIPSYLDYVKRGKLQEAYNTLTSAALTNGQFYQDNRTYASATGCSTAATTYFNYSCTATSATDFTLQAQGKSGSAVEGFTFTVDSTGTRNTTHVPTGWTLPSVSCWSNTRSGSCVSS
jgi:type IV pilus assembly protein PilE